MNITDNGLSAGETCHHHVYIGLQHPTDAAQLDVNDLVLRSIERFNGQRKGIAVHHRLQKHLWTVRIDDQELERVLLNVYVRAWQNMPVHGALFIETMNITPTECAYDIHDMENAGQNHFVCITVTDTGSGFSPEDRFRTFDLLFHASEPGTGLGLAFARAIIEAHGGRIDVNGIPGRGTTVSIFLPVSKGTDHE